MGIISIFDTLNSRIDNHLKSQITPESDSRREIGTVKDGKLWSGQNYGWQSKESYQKLQDQGEFRAGHIALSRLGSDLNYAYNQAPSEVHNAVNTVVNTASTLYEGIPPIIKNPLETGLKVAGDVNEAVSKTTNISQIITGEVLTAGAGKAVSLAKPLTKAALTQAALRIDAPVANALTITDPQFIARNVTQGVASGPDFGPAMRRWNARRNELIDQVRYPSGLTPHRRLENQKKSKIKAYNDVSTGPTTDPLDVEAYGKSAYKSKGMDQHHLFPKQESYVFVEQMKKIGDEDDVLNLFLYAEELDATMGGRLSNMLNMNKAPHNKLHSARKTDGRQLHPLKMANKVKSTKSTDELMELFDQYILENIRPSKAEAKKVQADFEQTRANFNQFKSLSEDSRRRL